jgi:hypothetical protein
VRKVLETNFHLSQYEDEERFDRGHIFKDCKMLSEKKPVPLG